LDPGILLHGGHEATGFSPMFATLGLALSALGLGLATASLARLCTRRKAL
jgi:hypothetical protein